MYSYRVRACNVSGCSPWKGTAYACVGNALRPAMVLSNQVTYLHTDALGSPVAETNASGTVTRRMHYEPYGAPTTGNYTDGPAFTGHVQDAFTGLTYEQQRYYDPLAGRFLSVDPVAASVTSFNRFWYGNNNPYKFVDPDGRYSCAASTTDCAKVDGFVNKLNESLKGLAKGSSDQKKLSAVSKLLGNNDGKEVAVKVGSLDQDTAGEASGMREVSLDTKNIGRHSTHQIRRLNPGMTRSDAASVAADTTLAHRVQHLIHASRSDYDGNPVGFPRNKAGSLSTERAAYGVEGSFGRGLDVDTGYSKPEAVEAGAQRSSAAWCIANGGC